MLAGLTGLVGCAGDGSAAPADFASFTPPAQMGWGADVADAALPYRPNPDGLSFPNYAPQDNFGVDDAVALFGDAAVCDTIAGACTPSPAAQAFVDTVAAAASVGVCEGMVLLSLDRFTTGTEPASSQLTIDAETNDRIVRLFATQFVPAVRDAANQSRGMPLADVVRTIEAGLAPGGMPYTLGLYSASGGHSLLPYAVRHVTDRQVAVYVYDPNWPQLDRFVEFDLDRDTWRFAFTTPDAANDPAPWLGGPDELDLVSLAARQSPFDAPFEGAGGAGRAVLTVTSDDSGWSITDGGTRIDPTTARPGVGGVLSVSRDLRRGSTVVLEVGDGALVSGNGALHVTVEDRRGAVGSSSVAGEVEVHTEGRLGLRQRTGQGDGSVQGYTRFGVVGAPAGSTVDIIDAQSAEVATPAGAQRTVAWLPGQRQDYAVNDDGSLAAVDPPSYPAEVRNADDRPTVLHAEGPTPTTTTTVAPTPVVDSSVAPTTTNQRVTPTTVNRSSIVTVPDTTTAPATTTTTTTTTAPPPPPGTQLQAEVVFMDYKGGLASVTVTPSPAQRITSFVIALYFDGVELQSWTAMKSPYTARMTGLTPGLQYVVKIFAEGYQPLVHNFTPS